MGDGTRGKAERMGQGRRTAERVVVTGVGAITSQGEGVEALWRGLRAGEVAIRPVRRFDMTGYGTALGGEVARAVVARRDPALEFLLVAAAEAMAASGLRPQRPDGGGPGAVPARRWGVVVGTCNGGLRSAELAWCARRAGKRVDPLDHLVVQPQVLAEAVGAEFGLKGPVLSVNTACASGAHAIAHAFEAIRAGRADAVLVAGADAFSETAFAGFTSLESLSPRPAAPYSRDRDGLSLGEGAGALVLTTLAVAEAAGAPVLAEVLGYGLSADGHHPTAPRPDGEGAARAIRAALDAAGVPASAVDYVNGHGTGTPKNDSAESNGVRGALGAHADRVPLSSVKSMIGHLLGAAGTVEAIATALALRDQLAPPTAGFTTPDPKCGLDPVPVRARPLPMEVALSNNFAFAGANAAVLYARPRAEAPAPRPPADDVVITGVGLVTPWAGTRAELWRRYLGGRGAVEDAGGVPVARVRLDADPALPPRQRRRMDRLGQFAVLSCGRALDDAGLDLGEQGCPRTGVVLGTGIGPVESLERFTLPVLAAGPGAANPAVFPNTVHNAAAGHVATLLRALGPTSTITSAHAAGACAVAVAADLLAAGAADAVLCPAVDALSPAALAAYADIPLFTRGRDPRFALAEGGIALVLERASVARARGARVLARLAGHGIASDGVGIGRWDPRGDGVERAMRAALDDAGLAPGDLASVWVGAAGLPSADRPERAAVDRLLGGRAVDVRAPKLVLGDPVGAGAHLAAALVAHSWSSGGGRGPALINSSSLGGTHACLVLVPETEVTP